MAETPKKDAGATAHGAGSPARRGGIGAMARWKKVLCIVAGVLLVAGIALQVLGASGGAEPAPGPGGGAAAAGGSGEGGGHALAPSTLTGSETSKRGGGETTGETWAPGFMRMGLSFFVAFAIGSVFRMFFRIAVLFVGLLALVLIGLAQLDLITIHWDNLEGLWSGFVERIESDFGQLRTVLTGSLPQAGLGALGLVAGFKRS
jgi:uncharacterized membrane protein (Fun14 family)